MAATEQAELTLSDPQMMEEIVRHFNQAMQLRSEMNARIARRVTWIIRVGMVTLTLSAVALLLLIYVLSDKAGSMVASLDTMNSHFSEMTHNMKLMEANVQRFSTYTSGMPTIMTEIESMDGTLVNLGEDMQNIEQQTHVMQGDMKGLATEMAGMDRSFDVMATSVSGVSQDVNQMSKPIRTFNNFFPFP